VLSFQKEVDYMIEKKTDEIEAKVCSEYSNTAGIVVYKDGVNVYEKYFNGYTAGNAVHICSVTKSVFSALIGIAVRKGYIGGIHQHVLDFFPDYTVIPGERTIQHITIKHLLTMTAPYKYDTEPYEKFFTSPHPVYDALDLLGGERPIGKFNYSAVGGTHILSGILAKAVGKSVFDFASENLFTPLGLTVPHSVVLHSEEEQLAFMNDKNSRGWIADPQGCSMASWGLFLTPSEMAEVGLLYLNGGVRDGRQLVPAEWIAESTGEQSRCEEWGMLYGYLWWLTGGGSYAALGDGGNVIYVNPEKDMVIAIASLLVPEPKNRIELIKTFIEPAFAD
jgi:CubicO group peptidase (beta-lactamase class C family)